MDIGSFGPGFSKLFFHIHFQHFRSSALDGIRFANAHRDMSALFFCCELNPTFGIEFQH